jgi:hypothetical protein
MESFSDYLENAAVDHAFKGTPLAQPTHLYIALCKSTITDEHTGVDLPGEVAGGGYIRRQCDSWNPATSGTITNATKIVFPVATSTWGMLTDFAVVDDSTGGHVYGYGKIDPPGNIGTGRQIEFWAGDIELGFEEGT